MYKPAEDSNAEKFGTIATFVILGFGVAGFLIKGVILLVLEGQMD